MPPKASTSSASPSNSRPEKLAVAAFLKLLTSQVRLSTQDAMACASPLIKNGYNVMSSPGANPLAGLSEVTLVSIGITDPDVRTTLVAYGRSGKGKSTVTDIGTGYAGKKRKLPKDSDLDSPLPTKAQQKEVMSLEFNEELEDYLLHDRSIVVNRAPVMLAWSVMVAERLGFNREEALSIAHTYTNLNATAKGVSLGIYSPEKGKERATVGPSQPYVNLLGRQIPVLSLQSGEWRGVAGGAIAEPEQAFGYIQRSFRQNMSAAMGAFRLLAESIEPDELNKIGYQLYAEFRPEVTGWGEKAHLSLAKILDLRRGPDGRIIKQEEAKPVLAEATTKDEPAADRVPAVKEEGEDSSTRASAQLGASPGKKAKLEVPPDIDPFDDDGGISDSDLAGLV